MFPQRCLPKTSAQTPAAQHFSICLNAHTQMLQKISNVYTYPNHCQLKSCTLLTHSLEVGLKSNAMFLLL